MKKVQIEDLLEYSFLSDAKYSPDGETIAFLVKKSKEDAGGYTSDLWLIKEERQMELTRHSQVREYFWKDNDHILFTGPRDEEDKSMREEGLVYTSVYQLDIPLGEIRKFAVLPLQAVSFERYDETHMIIHGMIDAVYPDYHLLSKEEQKKIAMEKREDEDYLILDEVPFYYNAAGYTNKLRRGLYFWDMEQGTVDRITPPMEDTYQTAVYQGRIAYIGFDFTHRWESWHDVFLYDPHTKETTCVYDRKDHRFWAMFTLGDKLMVRAAVKGHKESYSCPGEVYELDIDNRELRLFSDCEIMMANTTMTDCRMGGGSSRKNYHGRYYYIGTVNTSSVLNAFSADGGHETVFAKPGSIDSFDIHTQTGKFCAVCMFENRLSEVYELDIAAGTYKQLTAMNDEKLRDRYVADYRPITVRSGDVDVHGYVLCPENFDRNKKYPAILEIHGGPKGAYGEIFYHEMQVYVNAGYIVFFCNPTGSDGRGHSYGQIFNRLGQTDYQNVMDFTDEVLRQYPNIDQERIGVTGGSYGGFLTNWIIGHTDRFACAVSQRSISNWISMQGTSDIYYSAAYQTGARGVGFYDAAEQYWNTSPLKYAEGVTTPTLFIHSMEDYRCPLEQGLQMFTALADQGVETRMCIFKGENHELSRNGMPKHRLKRLREMKSWLDSHLMKG